MGAARLACNMRRRHAVCKGAAAGGNSSFAPFATACSIGSTDSTPRHLGVHPPRTPCPHRPAAAERLDDFSVDVAATSHPATPDPQLEAAMGPYMFVAVQPVPSHKAAAAAAAVNSALAGGGPSDQPDSPHTPGKTGSRGGSARDMAQRAASGAISSRNVGPDQRSRRTSWSSSSSTAPPSPRGAGPTSGSSARAGTISGAWGAPPELQGLVLGRPIASGSYGRVYLGRYHGAKVRHEHSLVSCDHMVSTGTAHALHDPHVSHMHSLGTPAVSVPDSVGGARRPTVTDHLQST